MDIEVLFEKLQSIDFRAAPTDTTMDMGIQYDYVSSKGAGRGFYNMRHWPAFKFSAVKKDKLSRIQSDLKAGTFTESSLNGTSLSNLVNMIHTSCCGDHFQKVNLLKMFDSLKDFQPINGAEFYCLFGVSDSGHIDHFPKFYRSKAELIDDFESIYCGYYTCWDEMGTDELEFWWKRIKEGDLQYFPYYAFEKEYVAF